MVRGQISWGQLFLEAIVRGAIILRGNYPRGQLSGGQLSGRQSSRGNKPRDNYQGRGGNFPRRQLS